MENVPSISEALSLSLTYTKYLLITSPFKVAQQLAKIVMIQNMKTGRNPRVLDMCCGVGISTRALQDAFPDSELVVGVDTSSEMITMAGLLTNQLGFIRHILKFFTDSTKKEQSKVSLNRSRKFPKRAKFTIGNAERTNFPSKSFDLVTVMYAFHEAPKAGRDRILQEAYRVLQPGGTLAVIDISTEYKPSATMLSGEPYGKFLIPFLPIHLYEYSFWYNKM